MFLGSLIGNKNPAFRENIGTELTITSNFWKLKSYEHSTQSELHKKMVIKAGYKIRPPLAD